MAKRLVTFAMAVCIGVAVAGTALAQTRPTTATAGDARQLFLDTLHELDASKNLTLEVLRCERSAATEAVTRTDHQAGTDTVDDGTQTFLIQRPGKLRFESAWSPRPSGSRYAPLVIFNHTSVLVAQRRTAGDPLQGSFGEMKGKSVDDVLRSQECGVRLMARELAYLLDTEAYERFFRFATGWEWSGAATDNGTKVWRVKFIDSTPEAQSWEAWVTQDKPRRLTRLTVGGPSTMGLIDAKPGVTIPEDNPFGDPSKLTRTSYNVYKRVELRFTKWDTTTAPKASDFERPAGNFKERPFEKDAPTYKVGDVVSLPPLTDADGHPVDLSKHAGPLVLDFWFAACGPCMHWTPRVEALVNEFAAKGVKLYGVNGTDTPAKAKQVAAKEGWTHLTNLIDAGQQYGLRFSVTGYPIIIVIGPDGKLLFRDFPGEDAAMDRLRDVLQKATGGPASTPHQ